MRCQLFSQSVCLRATSCGDLTKKASRHKASNNVSETSFSVNCLGIEDRSYYLLFHSIVLHRFTERSVRRCSLRAV